MCRTSRASTTSPTLVMPMQRTTPAEEASRVRISGREASSRTPARASPSNVRFALGSTRPPREAIVTIIAAEMAKVAALRPIRVVGEMTASRIAASAGPAVRPRSSIAPNRPIPAARELPVDISSGRPASAAG